MEYKRSRDELVPGDKVVYVYPGYAGAVVSAYEVDVVRVTKTRVVVVHPEKHCEEAFLKSSGKSIGSSDSYLSTRIEVGEWAERALTKGSENMKRNKVYALLVKAENTVKNTRIPLSEVVSLLETAISAVNR